MNYAAAFLGVTAAVAACSAAQAQTGQAQAARADVNIAPGPLAPALEAFGKTFDVQVVVDSGVAAGRRTGGVRGAMSATEALQRLLGGTGLEAVEPRPGVFVVAPIKTPSSSAALEQQEPVRLDEVVVTGSLLRGADQGASPVLIFRRDDLDKAGQATVADFLQALPQNFGGTATPDSSLTAADNSGSNTTMSTGLNLRGLGANATLVLVNGRRISGTGSKGDFADVSAIPTAAIERVDVLLDGASALYGSDAVGGVVNIILRKTFERQETRLRFGGAPGGLGQGSAAHTAGASWSGGHAVVSYEFSHKDALRAAERDYAASADLRPFGGADLRRHFSSPGNIVSGARVLYAIRPSERGYARSPADFAAGETNLFSGFAGQDIIAGQTRHGLFAAAAQSWGGLKFEADMRYSRRDYEGRAGGNSTTINVSRANPFFVSPNGASSHSISYSFLNDIGPQRFEGVAEALAASASVSADLGRTWRGQAYVAYGEETGRHRIKNTIHSRALSEALGNIPDDPDSAYAAARDGFFNPFGAGKANSAAVLDFVASGRSLITFETAVTSANLLVDGEVFDLPAGPVRLAFGAHLRTETYDRSGEFYTSGSLRTPTASYGPSADRRVGAIFGELRIPLVGDDNAVRGIERLELSLAGRIEDYDDAGTTADPKLGAVWSPASGLRVRASYGTSFRAPTLAEVRQARTNAASLINEGAQLVPVIVMYGGNDDLKPESSRSFTAGFDYEPQWLDGLSLSLGWFDIRYRGRIGQPAAENISGVLNDPIYATLVTRISPSTNTADLERVRAFLAQPNFSNSSQSDATSFRAIVDGRYVNAGVLQTRGVDVRARYDFSQGEHRFTAEADGVYLTRYRRGVTADAPAVDLLDTGGFPLDLRARGSLTWGYRSWTARATINYVDGYRDRLTGRSVDSWTTADLYLGWRPEAGFAQGLDISVSAQNLFDVDPPFYQAPAGYGYDAANADPVGRLLAVQVTKRW
ncbi:TonB-dependent receptor [Caulobacter segnis]|uniref:TonB-dependent receptor n=1 Tax=Caulobacter segnis TaxID=88688 RepID=UPI00240EF4E1|nr:TonB-dependent receptor [Caulobacter segnis]MDG2520529.1 TonB-dependent receptor [Caulobacter segnis]